MRGRILAGGALAILAVVLFILLAPGETDEEQTLSDSQDEVGRTEPGAPAEPGGDGSGAQQDPNGDDGRGEEGQGDEPARIPTVRVQDGSPVGGALELEVASGEQVRFVVRSDSAQEVHVHGYDIVRDAAPGAPARIAFEADLAGVYEVSLHPAHTPVAELTVNP